MKKLNYIMASCFGVAGVACAIWVTVEREHVFEMACLTFIFIILAGVAWSDYKNSE